MTHRHSFVAATVMGVALVALLAGCAHQPNPALPLGATQVASGDKLVAFTAPHDGIVYLRDDRDERIIYSSEVQKGETVKFDPASRHVLVGDRVVAEKVPDVSDSHSIFYQRSDQPDRAAAETTAGSPVLRVPVGVGIDLQTRPAIQQ